MSSDVTKFQTVPSGADTNATVPGDRTGSGSLDFGPGDSRTITFDFMNNLGTDAGTFSVAAHPPVGTLVVNDADAGTATFTITFAQWQTGGFPPAFSMQVENTLDNLAAQYTLSVTCFAEGTEIATPSGSIAVEDLKIGDAIRTSDGRTIAVKWIGQQKIDTVFASVPERARLVEIAAGALGDGLPHRTLRVTTDHAMVLEGYLINAAALFDVPGVQLVPLGELGTGYTIYHIETDAHDVILAEGSPTETYVDHIARSAFDNNDEFLDRYGVPTDIAELPLPRISAPRLLPKGLRDRLNAKALAEA